MRRGRDRAGRLPAEDEGEDRVAHTGECVCARSNIFSGSGLGSVKTGFPVQKKNGQPVTCHCPTRADGVRIACDRVREAFRQYAPHKKKRCVPMTGKQKCEVVPGGCTQ